MSERSIEFEIDADGNMTVDIHGIVGPACDNIQKLLEQLTGAPASVDYKPSYYEHVNNVGRVTR